MRLGLLAVGLTCPGPGRKVYSLPGGRGLPHFPRPLGVHEPPRRAVLGTPPRLSRPARSISPRLPAARVPLPGAAGSNAAAAAG